jgi:hypothetical protein
MRGLRLTLPDPAFGFTGRVHDAAPEASARVVAAQEIAGLDAKLANVAAEIPRAFFDPGVEKGMNTRVEIDLPLSTGE